MTTVNFQQNRVSKHTMFLNLHNFMINSFYEFKKYIY